MEADGGEHIRANVQDLHALCCKPLRECSVARRKEDVLAVALRRVDLFAGRTDLGLVCAPLLMHHPFQLLTGALLAPRLARYVRAASPPEGADADAALRERAEELLKKGLPVPRGSRDETAVA